MTTTRVTPAVWIILLLLPLATIGCQLGFGAQPAPAPLPPAAPLPPPTPTLEERRMPAGVKMAHNTKALDGDLHVWYIPCGNQPATWIASIILSDLRSGSVVYLNQDGTLKTSPEPVYLTEAGRGLLEAALKDSSIMEQVVARPSCLDQVYEPTIQQRYGWPDAYAEDIGNPPIPRVAMGTWPKFTESPPPYGYPGWRGAFCWPVSGASRKCDDTATWEGFAAAGALEPGRFYVAILGDDANPGMIRRVRVFPAQEKWSTLKLGRVLHLGAEVHRVVATKGETLDKFVLPTLPGGDYLLIASYESALGEVEYGFKVAFGK